MDAGRKPDLLDVLLLRQRRTELGVTAAHLDQRLGAGALLQKPSRGMQMHLCHTSHLRMPWASSAHVPWTASAHVPWLYRGGIPTVISRTAMGAVVSFSFVAFRRFAAVSGPVECIGVRLLMGFLTTT